MSQSAESAAYLQMRLALVEARVRALVALRRSSDPDADDAFRGLYVSDDQVDRMLAPSPEIPPLPPPATSAQSGPEEAWADAREEEGRSLRLRRLMRPFELDSWDVEILVISLAPDLDPRFERLYGYLNDDVSRRRACPGLALDLCGAGPGPSPLGSELLARLHPHANLIAGGLLVVEEPERPLLTRPLRVPDRVIGHLLGDDRPPPELAPHLTRGATARLPGARRVSTAIRNGSTLLYVRDESRAGGHALGKCALAAVELPPVGLDLASLDAGADAETLGREAIREAQLAGGGLVAGPVDALADGQRRALRALCGAGCPVVLWGFGTWDPLWSDRIPVLMDAPLLAPEVRRQVWEASLNGNVPAPADLDRAVSQYRLDPEQIRRAADLAVRTAAAEGGTVDADVLQAGARAQNAGALERLTRRIEPRAGWGDLVLPRDGLRQLQELAERARLAGEVLPVWRGASSRGRGVSALFAGESGTGKTMSAEIVAGDLGMDLYVIDLSTVVDKYIGETEKNLERIFVEADRVNGVLLFDEADAVFGKRAQVQDAHDRYANVETSYLLQRIERFDGLAILTTNLRNNIDDAFIRRLDAIVDFPYPGEQDRRRLWEVHLRRGVEDPSALDLDFLAGSFRLSGGNIASIVLGAAFLAATEAVDVDMTHLVRATEREYRKLGHLCVPEEFGPYYSVIART